MPGEVGPRVVLLLLSTDEADQLELLGDWRDCGRYVPVLLVHDLFGPTSGRFRPGRLGQLLVRLLDSFLLK